MTLPFTKWMARANLRARSRYMLSAEDIAGGHDPLFKSYIRGEEPAAMIDDMAKKHGLETIDDWTGRKARRVMLPLTK